MTCGPSLPASCRLKTARERRLARLPGASAQPDLLSIRPAAAANFLIIALRELRALEMEVLRALHPSRPAPVARCIGASRWWRGPRFYGIRIRGVPRAASPKPRCGYGPPDERGAVRGIRRLFTRIPLQRQAPPSTSATRWSSTGPRSCRPSGAATVRAPRLLSARNTKTEQREQGPAHRRAGQLRPGGTLGTSLCVVPQGGPITVGGRPGLICAG